MELIENIEEKKEKIIESIRKYGHQPEHNFCHYMHLQDKKTRNVFVMFEESMGILGQIEKSNTSDDIIWRTVAEPLAPEEKKLGILSEFFEYVFSQPNVKKVVVEYREEFRKKVIEMINEQGILKARPATDILYWPLFKMQEWNDKLEGKDWKIIRNLINRLNRENKIEIKDSKEVSKEALKELALRWKKDRTPNDRVAFDQYINLIETNFEGCDSARTFLANGIPISITAGWCIPNTKNYYSAVGIYDYNYKGIGEACNVDDLIELKKKNYELVDFGGSDGGLLDFKKKFKPNSTYTTYIFSIAKK